MSKRRAFIVGATAVVLVLGLAAAWVTVRERAIWADARKELRDLRLLVDQMVSKHEAERAEADKDKKDGPQLSAPPRPQSDK
jgi:hypothetical protein